MPDNNPELAKRLSKTDPALLNILYDLKDYVMTFPGVELTFPNENKFIVFEGQSIHPRRKNFAEGRAFNSHITLWLNRDGNFAKFARFLEVDPTRTGTALDKKIVLTKDSDPTIFKNLLRMAYSHLSGIDESELENSIQTTFEHYLYSENREGSGQASSYLKALHWLQEMFKIESYGFDDMLDIWSVNNVDRFIELRARVFQEQKKGADTPWLGKDISVSYLRDYPSSAAPATSSAGPSRRESRSAWTPATGSACL